MSARARRRISPRLVLAGLTLLLSLLPLLLGAAPRENRAAPRENRIYLSARAPWGDRRALPALSAACRDTTWRDTLYLSFEPAQDESTFLGFSGELYTYAQPGDTLGNFWAMERGGANNGGLVVQFGPDESFPQPQPWPVQGIGSATYDRSRESGRFRFFFAVPFNRAGPVKAGKRYVLARILLGAKHRGLGGCERPVCLEWHAAALSYRTGAPVNVTAGGSRWLARGSEAGACRNRIPAWRPKGVAGSTVVPPTVKR